MSTLDTLGYIFLKKNLMFIQNICGKLLVFPILHLRSNEGGEFKALTSFLQTHGIEHRVSCPYTSQQNGIAERKYRQIVNIGLTLLSQASMPLRFWDISFSTSVYLSNGLLSTT